MMGTSSGRKCADIIARVEKYGDTINDIFASTRFFFVVTLSQHCGTLVKKLC